MFDQFTNQYALSKTLRFELKPVGGTLEFLDKIRPKDEQRDKWYHETMKPILDELHNTFIQESLKTIQFPKENIESLYLLILELEKLSKDRKHNESKIETIQKQIENAQKILRGIVGCAFDINAEKWIQKYKEQGIELKGKGCEILTGKELFGTTKQKGLLEVVYEDDEEKLIIIKDFKGFSMYFDGFSNNRNNYYTTEGKHTEIAYRIINENLPRFLKSKKSFDLIKKEITTLFQFESDFKFSNFQNLLVQKDIDTFNVDVIGEINYQVNQYNQQNETRLPKLEVLYKQIGSPKKNSFLFIIEENKEWEELENLQGSQNKLVKLNKQEFRLLDNLKKYYESFFQNIENLPLGNIYFNKQSINTISSYWFISWYTLAEILSIKEKKGEYAIPSQISLQELKEKLGNIENVVEKNEKGGEESTLLIYFRSGVDGKYERIIQNCATAWEAFLNIWKTEIEDNFTNLEQLQIEFSEKKQKTFNKKEYGKFVKEMCDAYLAIERMTKYHKVKDNTPTNSNFYEIFDLYEKESELNKYYNAFRNYISQKPYSQNKIKLTFECGYLLKNGWDKNYDTNGATIFEKDGEYYLGIIHKKLNKKELGELKEIDSEIYAKKLVYISQKIDNKNPPRWFIRSKEDTFSPLVREGLLDPSPILGIYDQRLFTKDKNKASYKEYLPQIIDYFKQGFLVHPDFKEFEFSWMQSTEYDTVADFYNHTAEMCYKIDWEEIDWEKLLELNKQERISLFRIYNKDFGNKATGQKNLHTLLFLELLKRENSKNLQLLGNGEIFFREKSIKKEEIITKDKKQRIEENNHKGEKAYQKNRYTEDRYLLHFPISIGKGSMPGRDEFNYKVNTQYLSQKTNIIGIDRGEKHLIYVSVIDQNQNILEQKSYNILEVAGKDIDFHKKLKERASEMMEGRKNWQEIGTIKNFKEGYLSYVVHQIYQLVEKHNAIIILEDLNTQFKAKRTAQVEYALYKKFELALAKKLNHLIFKEKQPTEVGGVLNALQLTPKIESGNISIFEKSKQWGIIYYVRPNYTSVTDPLTGWRKHKYISNGAKIDDIISFFEDQDIQIEYDASKRCFVFSYFHNGKHFKLHTFEGLERYRYLTKEKKVEKINLFEEFEKLLGDYKTSQNIILELQDDDNFSWKTLVYLWNLLNQIRNTDKSKEGNENDFLQSPVWSDEIQGFYDSRKHNVYREKFQRELPENGDANGAYNTARKGFMLLKRQLISPENKDFLIKDEDWDEFVSKYE